jgi:hypothetical protein
MHQRVDLLLHPDELRLVRLAQVRHRAPPVLEVLLQLLVLPAWIQPRGPRRRRVGRKRRRVEGLDGHRQDLHILDLHILDLLLQPQQFVTRVWNFPRPEQLLYRHFHAAQVRLQRPVLLHRVVQEHAQLAIVRRRERLGQLCCSCPRGGSSLSVAGSRSAAR